jgi:hypothetical protein
MAQCARALCACAVVWDKQALLHRLMLAWCQRLSKAVALCNSSAAILLCFGFCSVQSGSVSSSSSGHRWGSVADEHAAALLTMKVLPRCGSFKKLC